MVVSVHLVSVKLISMSPACVTKSMNGNEGPDSHEESYTEEWVPAEALNPRSFPFLSQS